MTKATKTTKAKTQAKATKKQNIEEWFDISLNKVVLRGAVKRVFFTSDKVVKFTLDTVSLTPNEKYAHSFVPVTMFTLENDVELVEGDIIEVNGNISTSSYNGKYTTEVITDFDNVTMYEN